MKGLIYFILFFTLAITWFLLVDSADDIEKAEVDMAPASQVNISIDKQEQQVGKVFLDQSSHQVLLDLQTALKAKDWQQSVEIYKDNYIAFLDINGVEKENHPLKGEMLNTMNYLLAANDLDSLSVLTQYALSFYKYDVEFSLYRMNGLISESKINQALNLYFQSIEEISDADDRLFFSQQFEKWLDGQITSWQAIEAFESIEQVGLILVTFDSQNMKWQMLYAQSLMNQSKFKKAKDVVEPLTFDWDYKQKALALMDIINEKLEAGGINLKKRGNHYIVDAIFKDNKISRDQVQVALLIDTGASMTVIDQQFFDQQFKYLNVNFTGTVTANTANGTVEANVYNISEMQISGFQVQDIQFMVLDLPDGQGDSHGLLGMNFLQHFKFNIDQVNSVLNLSY